MNISIRFTTILILLINLLSLNLFSQDVIAVYLNEYENARRGIYVANPELEKKHTIFISVKADDEKLMSGFVLGSVNQKKFSNKLIELKEKYCNWLTEANKNQLKENSLMFKEKFPLIGYYFFDKDVHLNKFLPEVEVTFERFQINDQTTDLFAFKVLYDEETTIKINKGTGASLVFSSPEEVDKFISIFK